jgi:hypothetical protein
LIDTNYYKVSVQYIQHTELLVAAKTEDEAIEMVKSNVLPETEGFKINGVSGLSEDEQKIVIANLMGLNTEETDTPEPSGEVQDTRTLN